MAGNRPVLGFGGALADHHLVADEPATATAGAARDRTPARSADRPSAHAARATPLNVQRLVDRLVRDTH